MWRSRSSMMLSMVVVVLVTSVAAHAQLEGRCSERTELMSLRPLHGGANGSYEVTYCPGSATPEVTTWQLALRLLNVSQEQCVYEKLRYGRVGEKEPVHSISWHLVDVPQNLTCNNVCFSQIIDLMFAGCYRLASMLYKGSSSQRPHTHYYYADNNVTQADYSNTSQFTHCLDHDDYVSLVWHEGRIPLRSYRVQYEMVYNNDTQDNKHQGWLDARDNCTRGARSVDCRLRLPEGCYIVRLEHVAPWTNGQLLRNLQYVDKTFCHATSVPATVPGSTAGWARVVGWSSGVGVLAAVCAGAAALVCRTRLRAKLRRAVQDYWTRVSSGSSVAECGGGVGGGSGGCVVLVYAREGERGARAVRALTDLLRHHLPPNTQVLDLYSSVVTARAAPAPHQWVRALLSSADARVLLLQTPALAAVAATPAPTTPPAAHGDARAPLLPHYGDTLVELTLRLMTETVHPQPYRKYYLATFSGLPVDVFSSVVPYRRYPLPEAARLLAADLAPAAAPAPGPPDDVAGDALLEQLRHAAQEFVTDARTHAVQ